MKTLNGWNQSEHSDFDSYVKRGQEIDEEIYDYFLGVLPPIYHKNGVFQVSEPYSSFSGQETYSTFKKLGVRFAQYYYLGHLTKNQASNDNLVSNILKYK